MKTLPPPVIGASKLVRFADATAPVEFTRLQAVYLGETLIGAAPGIAICRHIADGELHLLLCDEDWDVISFATSGKLDDLVAKAERWYRGLSEKWVDTPYSEEDCETYISQTFGETRCAFCQKWPWEYATLFSQNGCNVCDVCVKEFYSCLADREMGEGD